MKRLALAAALALFAALPAAALDATQRAALDASATLFDQLNTSGDYTAAVAAMPPGFIAYMAGQMQTTPEALRAGLTQQVADAMAKVTIESFSLDLDHMTAGETPDGMAYAFIPTTSRVSAPNVAATDVSGTTLALEEDGAWYFLNVGQPGQYALVQAAYPGFATIALP